jgi:HEAT repeat protein
VRRLHDSAPRARIEAAHALAELADRRCVGPLCDAHQDHDWNVRTEAARALIGDNDLDVRKQALEALGEILSRSSSRASPENLRLVAELGSVIVDVASDGEGFFGGCISSGCAEIKQLARQELVLRGLLK